MHTTFNPQQISPCRTEALLDNDPRIILNKMNDAYRRYSQIPDTVKGKAFVWLAEKKPISVVVGSAHHAGKYGIPNLLASEGYTLTPLLKIAPPRKSTLIYESVFRRKFEVKEANRAKAIIIRTRG